MEKTVNTATQGAEQTARLHISALNELLPNSSYTPTIDDDGEEYPTRPNVEVFATLSNETEDYVRILKTLAQILPVYHNALRGTYYGGEKARERYAHVVQLFCQLRDEIGHDMGVCMADRLSEWKEDYI